MADDNIFPIRPVPAQAGDKTLNEYWDLAVQLMKDDAARLLNPETLFHVPEPPKPEEPPMRAYDLQYDYASYRPVNERWECIDVNTYDGAPDSEGCSHFVGRGPTEKAARDELLERFEDYDSNARRPRAGIIVNTSPTDPPEFISHNPTWREDDDE